MRFLLILYIGNKAFPGPFKFTITGFLCICKNVSMAVVPIVKSSISIAVCILCFMTGINDETD